MYADCVLCCPIVSHGEYADVTDGRTPDRYITLSARCGQCYNKYYAQRTFAVHFK